MQIVLNNLQTAVWLYDMDHHCVIWANSAGLSFWHSPSHEELQQRDFKTGLSEAVKDSLTQYKQTFEQGQVIQENWFFTPKGKEVEAFCQFSGFRLQDGRLAMLVEAIQPTSTYHPNQLSNTSAMVSSFTTSGQFISANPPFFKSFGKEVSNIIQFFSDSEQFERILQSISETSRFEDDLLMKTLQGERWYRLVAQVTQHEQGEDSLHLHQYDIHEHRSNEENLKKQAITDPLTGLLNRRGLSQILQTSIQDNRPFSMLYIDLDGFKMVNDSSGHATGDLVLKELASRLAKLNIANSDICRFGGDEFVLIIYQLISDKQKTSILDELILTISKPYQVIANGKIQLSASIGLSHFPKDGQNMEHLITCADVAMYKAKKLGKKRWFEYKTGMEQELKRLSDISLQLASAEKQNELSLHYQPIVDASTRNIVSFEALLRWNNPVLGQVNPEEVIKVAEETGLIHDIENWVLRRAIQDLVIFKEKLSKKITMAVNLSGTHMSTANLGQYVLSLLDQYQLQPQDLTIELTESVLLHDLESKNSPAHQITKQGFKLNIDDFGTGYSSLAYLHAIPASVVKVDRTFLQNADSNIQTLECIEKLITSLNMQSLIEGIETEYQATLLAEIGFSLQQGYYHGRPQPLSYYLSGALEQSNKTRKD